MSKVKTGLFIQCPCGSKAAVFESKSRYYAHCVGCGRISFWANPQLTEKIRLGGQLCSHKPPAKDCKGGKTSFCQICRVRTFIPAT